MTEGIASVAIFRESQRLWVLGTCQTLTQSNPSHSFAKYVRPYETKVPRDCPV